MCLRRSATMKSAARTRVQLHDCPSQGHVNAPTRSEENYRTIFENALEGIVRTSLDGRVLSANPTLARIFGYASPEEMIADVTDIQRLYVGPHERDALMSTLAGKGAVIGYETELYLEDGQRIWVSFSGRVVRGASGEPGFVEGFVTEAFTEGKRAEEALRESEQRCRDYAETASDWLWETGPDHCFTHVSERLTALDMTPPTGPASGGGTSPPTSSKSPRSGAFMSRLRGASAVSRLHVQDPAADGSVVYIATSGKPVFDA